MQLSSRLLAAGLQIALLASAGALPSGPNGDVILARMAAHQLADNKVLAHYTGVRRYTLHNSRFDVSATLTVRMEYRAGIGKTFTIMAESGSQRVRQRVFDPLLKTEEEESRPNHRDEYAMNASNYRAQVIGREMLNGSDCWVLSIEPLRRSRFLLRGTLWVDAGRLQPVQIKGRPASSISFWVADPTITETLGEWNGFWLPARNTSVSRGFFLGKSDLTIEYLDYTINVKAPHWAPK